jgi:hypothetical protein
MLKLTVSNINNVLPSLDCVLEKTLLEEGTEKPTFVDMQKYFRHLTTAHDQLLPGGGQFILPKDKSTVPGGFWCSSCGHHFCRQDSFKIQH